MSAIAVPHAVSCMGLHNVVFFDKPHFISNNGKGDYYTLEVETKYLDCSKECTQHNNYAAGLSKPLLWHPPSRYTILFQVADMDSTWSSSKLTKLI